MWSYSVKKLENAKIMFIFLFKNGDFSNYASLSEAGCFCGRLKALVLQF